MKFKFNLLSTARQLATGGRALDLLILVSVATALAGCGGSSTPEKQNRSFFTSGSREADQRASQRMAQAQQLAGTGEGAGEKGVKPAVKTESNPSDPGSTNKAAQAVEKLALFDRLGAEQGIAAIVEDFLPRVMHDPRVNWPRNDVRRGGFSLGRSQSDAWRATPENIARLKKHMVQFLALATGGPAKYDGK
ncbi:MAG: hypothetical protein H7Y43_14505, partial [Akkermansiaceae bacterium]|nr:hypothetical protein [Verrucomicrobiales bacterium]